MGEWITLVVPIGFSIQGCFFRGLRVTLFWVCFCLCIWVAGCAAFLSLPLELLLGAFLANLGTWESLVPVDFLRPLARSLPHPIFLVDYTKRPILPDAKLKHVVSSVMSKSALRNQVTYEDKEAPLPAERVDGDDEDEPVD